MSYLEGCLKREPDQAQSKPCHILGYCPYGQLVEEFPLDVQPSDISCKVFGHNCPVYYCAESFSETVEVPA